MTGAFDKDFELLLSFFKSRVEDRVLAIVCAGYADKYLAELIKYRLPGMDTKLEDKLFNPIRGGILGPFSARIDLAQALKSVDPDTHDDLIILARIRNRFAHDLAISSFDHAEIVPLMAKLKHKPTVDSEISEGAKQMKAKWAKLNNRARFEIMGLQICMALHAPLNRISQMKKAGSEN